MSLAAVDHTKKHDHFLFEGVDHTVFFFTREKKDENEKSKAMHVNFIVMDEDSDESKVDKVRISDDSSLYRTLSRE